MTRHYGLKLGDEVKLTNFNGICCYGTIVGFDYLDNNRCMIRTNDGNTFDWVCEWCRKLDKI